MSLCKVLVLYESGVCSVDLQQFTRGCYLLEVLGAQTFDIILSPSEHAPRFVSRTTQMQFLQPMSIYGLPFVQYYQRCCLLGHLRLEDI